MTDLRVCTALAAFASVALTTGALADGGDNWASAVDISGQFPGTFTGDTTENSDAENEECPYDDTGGQDEWYAFTADVDAVWTFDLCGSSYDTKVYIYNTDAEPTWELITCNDDSTACEEDGRSKIWAAQFIAGNEYAIVVDGFDGTAFGEYEMIVSTYEPCEQECPNGGILEGEPQCVQDYVDEFNSGCNYEGSGDFPFSLIACGDTMCGESGTYLSGDDLTRDTDWYEAEITGDPGQCFALTMNGIAEFPPQFLIIYGGDLTCDEGSYTIIASAQGDPCTPLELTRNEVPQGTYWMWVGPAVFEAFWECPSDYVMTLDCVEDDCIGDIDCPPDSIPEGETDCFYDYVDDYNPGCNGTPIKFQDIECNTTICGTSGTYATASGTSRDMDWFTFTTEYGGDFDWIVTAEYPVVMWLFDGGSGDCQDYSTIQSLVGENPGTPYKVFGNNLEPGEYWVVQSTSDWEWYPCGLEWYGELQCDEDIPCELECADGATPEGEDQCYTGYEDVTNGGCHSDTFAEGSISIGETICGYTGIYKVSGLDEQDEDWFAFTSAGESIVFTVQGEVNMAGYIIKQGASSPCTGFSLVTSGSAAACETLELSATLQAGQDYWFVVLPVATGEPSPCDSLYNASLALAIPDCPEDITGPDLEPDGVVDVLDLLLVLGQWGTSGPEGDVNGPDGTPDGIVDVIDLLAILGAWGEC